VISDGSGGTANAALAITVTAPPINNPPVAGADPGRSTTRNQPLSITIAELLANDSDPDGDSISIESFAATTAQGGTVSRPTPSSFLYTPAAGFSGSDSITYVVTDGFGGTANASLAITVTEPALRELFLVNTIPSLAENSSTASRIKVADIVITDDAPGSNVITLAGADAPSFEVIGSELFLKAGTALDFETKNSYVVTVSASNPSRAGGAQISAPFALAVTDMNEAPTALTLVNTVTSLAENSSTTYRIKVANIVIADDALGSNNISLSGTDAANFEVDGTGLFLKAGTSLDFETKSSYTFNATVNDPTLPGSMPALASLTPTIADVNELHNTTANITAVEITLPNGKTKSIPVTFNLSDFSVGSSLGVITNLGIDPAGLTTLSELGITPNGSGLDFRLTVDIGASASLNALLDLVAADLVPHLVDPITGARRADRKLSYYGVNATGALSPLTYDPITRAGARFYDLDNSGTADFFTLSLIDGRYGDKDGLVNGVIDDPSFAGYADLTNLQFTNDGTGAVTIIDPSNAAPAAVSLRASLSSRPTSSNQIGYVVLDPTEVANADSLLSNLNWLRGRAQSLFATLESFDVTLPAGSSFERDLQLINGQSLRIFEVVDANLEQLSSLSDSRFRLLNPGTVANGQVAFSSTSGVNFSLSLLPTDPGLNALISQAQGLAPVLDLSAFTAAQSLSGTVAMGREAAFNSSSGFYRTLDVWGAVLAADGITRIQPGDSGYAAAALRTSNLIDAFSNLSVADDQTSSRSFSAITGGSFLAPFAQVNGNTFFAYGAANTDGLSHFRSLGNNLFGLEDIIGGGDKDFDDVVIGFNFTTIV
jgi:hypothetical protein